VTRTAQQAASGSKTDMKQVKKSLKTVNGEWADLKEKYPNISG